jgi:hypothetical protein
LGGWRDEKSFPLFSVLERPDPEKRAMAVLYRGNDQEFMNKMAWSILIAFIWLIPVRRIGRVLGVR